jgi:CBS domain-containing protein
LKTSSISLRVADFLKAYPPFEYLSESDLLEIAKGGRVKFHEADEILFDVGQPRSRFIWVVQRGTINLYRPGEHGEDLVDVRAEGDLVGIDYKNPHSPYPAIARVAQESILYALPADILLQICGRHPRAVGFLNSYFSIEDVVGRAASVRDAVELEADAAYWLTRSAELDGRSSNRLLTASPSDSIKAVALSVAPGRQEAVVIVDEDYHPRGIVTEADFSRRVATGEVSVDRPVSEIMSSPVITIAPHEQAGDIIIQMIRHRRHHLVVTETGEPDSRVVGVVAEKTIQAMHGNVPIFLSKEFPLATDINELRRLRDRADELLLRYIEGEAPIQWLTNFIAQVDRMLTEQAIELAKEKLAAQGLPEPELPWAWIAFHSEGRKERLLRSSQRTGIVYADPPPGFDAQPMLQWFSALANEMGTVLSVCRFPLDAYNRMASNPTWCCSVSEWVEIYRPWVIDPVTSDIIRRTPFFDLRAVTGDRSLVGQIRQAIIEHIKLNPEFIPVLATAAMRNLPPVTVFRGGVLDQSGGTSEAINTKTNALSPLVDLARVFALGLSMEDATFTPDRLSKAAVLLPQYARVFHDAERAFDYALRLQTRVGLRRGDDARFVRPDELTRGEMQRLKTIFRTVSRLMDVAVNHFFRPDR